MKVTIQISRDECGKVLPIGNLMFKYVVAHWVTLPSNNQEYMEYGFEGETEETIMCAIDVLLLIKEMTNE